MLSLKATYKSVVDFKKQKSTNERDCFGRSKRKTSGGMDCHFNESDGDIQRGCLKKFGLSGKSSGSTEASDQSYVT